MAGVLPAKGEWGEDCTTAVKALLLEQYCLVRIVDVLEEGPTYAVEVVLESSGRR